MTQKDENWILRRDHTYYYHVQTQLNVCKLVYCDFIVWTETGVAVERISKDFAFYETVMEDIFLYVVCYQRSLESDTRKPVADCNGVVPVLLPSTQAMSTDDSNEQSEDYSKVWC